VGWVALFAINGRLAIGPRLTFTIISAVCRDCENFPPDWRTCPAILIYLIDIPAFPL
jgi:hypothetical protein